MNDLERQLLFLVPSYDLPFVRKFCEVYKVELRDVSDTDENGEDEKVYFFTDHNGGYTFHGILTSLKETRGLIR